MAKVSNARKIGILGGVIGKRVGQSRTFRATVSAGRATGGHFGRILGQLWLQVTGFVFLFFAGVGAIYLFRECVNYQAGHTTPSRVIAATGFTIVFGWFGVSSFWRVRRKKS